MLLESLPREIAPHLQALCCPRCQAAIVVTTTWLRLLPTVNCDLCGATVRVANKLEGDEDETAED